MITAVTVGLLAAGPAAGCSARQEPAPPPPPTTATGVPGVPPLPLPQSQPPEGPTLPEPGLGPQDRALLTDARRIGAPWVIVLMATEPGRTAEVTAAVQRLGGVIGTTSPGPGYLRSTVPTDQVERAGALPGVSALDIEQVVTPHQPRPTG